MPENAQLQVNHEAEEALPRCIFEPPPANGPSHSQGIMNGSQQGQCARVVSSSLENDYIEDSPSTSSSPHVNGRAHPTMRQALRPNNRKPS